MARFRKKPVIIEAEQWFPDVQHEGVGWEPEADVPSRAGGVAFKAPSRAYVTTIHGQRAYLAPGDWIIPEPKEGHFYPCRPDIFAETYEPVA